MTARNDRISDRHRSLCARTHCGCTARYQSLDTGARYCPEHAADICAHVRLRPIEGTASPRQRLRSIS